MRLKTRIVNEKTIWKKKKKRTKPKKSTYVEWIKNSLKLRSAGKSDSSTSNAQFRLVASWSKSQKKTRIFHNNQWDHFDTGNIN